MFEPLYSLFTLRWRNEPKLRPLPNHIQRVFVPSPGGNLELLVSSPSISDPATPPIFFAHGGYGSAGVWIEWMTCLHEAGYRGKLYAYSARNHGASYSVPYFKMVYNTPFEAIIDDCMKSTTFARKQQELEGLSQDFVLVGHSSGGGVAQYSLANGLTRCRALCLIDAIPHYGALPVYANWAKHDPWFMLRSLFHLQHPTSPLSSQRLVHGAFFGDKFPSYKVKSFMQWMPAYESMWWPMGMMGNFMSWWRGSPKWLNVRDILSNIQGSSKYSTQDRICVMLGDQDVLMDLDMGRRQVAEYRQCLQAEKAGDGQEPRQSTDIEGVTTESGDGVRLVVVEGPGHHIQNDVQRDQAAEGLLRFAQQS